MRTYTEKEKDRFWSHVDRRGPTECWNWTGVVVRGYGQFGHRGKNIGAHRVAWEVSFGFVPGKFGDGPERKLILHSCDNPACCNPKHLFLGTQADNMNDMIRKGRSLRGERHPNAKLTVAQVRKIRSSSTLAKELAKRFGVDKSLIYQVRNRIGWRSLP